MDSSKIGVGIIGLGRIAHSHIDAIKELPDTAELAAVADLRENLAQEVAQEHGVSAYSSTEKLLEDDRIQAVVVCLPHDLHAPVSVQAADAGRHVLVEKVMARSYREGLQMVEAADRNGVKLMVGQSRRYFQALQEAHRRRDEIGRIRNLLYTFACYFDVSTAPQWWRSKDSTGGLVYPMLGSHSVDYTLWMMDDRDPVSVFARGASNNEGFEGDDDVTIVVEFDDGTHATNFLSINNRPARHEALVIGEEGSIYFTQEGDHIGLIGTADTDLFVTGEKIMSGDPKPHAFTVQMQEFIGSIGENREPSSSGRKVLTQLDILEAADTSAREGRMIELAQRWYKASGVESGLS